MNKKYNLIFEGKILLGFDVEEVKVQISQLLKISEQQQEEFFSGKSIYLKKEISFNEAAQLKLRLEKQGLMTFMMTSQFADLVSLSENSSIVDINKSRALQPNYEKEKRENSAISERRVEYREEYNQRVLAQPSVNFYQPPSPFHLFSLKGRYGCLSYVNAHLLWLTIVAFIVFIIARYVVGMDLDAMNRSFDEFKAGLMASGYIIYSILMFRQTVLRLHDIGMTGYFCILQIIPVIGWCFILFLLLTKGMRESNEYGVAPEQGSTNLICILLGAYFFFAVYGTGLVFK